MINKYLLKFFIEFIGTFVLVNVVLRYGSNIYGAIAIGIALAALVFFGGYITTGCFNPAVTLGNYLAGSIDQIDLIFYIIVQMLAAVCAYYMYMSQQKNLII